MESPWLDRNPVCFTHRNSLSFCVLNCVYQRERWLKPARAKSVWVCRRETAWESRYCRNAKRSPFVCVLVWVYFEHERFESGFRDLTLCVKVLRSHGMQRLLFTNAARLLHKNAAIQPLCQKDCAYTNTLSIPQVCQLCRNQWSFQHCMKTFNLGITPEWSTGEAHFCASAFSYVLRSKTGPFFVILFCSNFHGLEALKASTPALMCFVLICSRLALRLASNFVSSIFFFGFAAISITLRSWGLPWPRLASPRPRRASKRLDCRLASNIIERERLSWSRQEGTRG